jgi:23S rRNA (pseudouridine1915-N3)-methyltransferase
MRIVIAAIGRLKKAERDLCDRYIDRVTASGRAIAIGPVTEIELPESRAGDAASRAADEAARLLKSQAGSAEVVVVLDESGRQYASDVFAQLLAKHRDQGVASMAFLVGGPDGHGEVALAAAHFRLALGHLTLPHGLARIVLAEQIFRTATILSGHPYHRQGRAGAPKRNAR